MRRFSSKLAGAFLCPSLPTLRVRYSDKSRYIIQCGMPKNSSPDWFARGTALLAIALTGVGLYFTQRTYSWQARTYQEGLEERILVRLSFSRDIDSNQGDVDVEVVNIGMHPIFIRYIEMQPPNCKGACGLPIYDHSRLTPNEHIKSLDPGDVESYTTKWDFSKFPLQEWVLESKRPEPVKPDAVLNLKSEDVQRFYRLYGDATLNLKIEDVERLYRLYSLYGKEEADRELLKMAKPDMPSKEHLWVRVETTKKSFRQRPNLFWVEMYGSVPQERRSPAKPKK